MKTAVVLRHAERQDRTDNGSHLSQAGIGQAREAARWFERFDLVITSTLPRAVETAIAMGFASRTHPGIQDAGDSIAKHVRWDAGYVAWAAACRSVPLVSSYVDDVTSLLRGWMDDLPDGGSLLVVTHGGIVEALAVGLGPDSDWTLFGPGAGYAEGFVALTPRDGAPQLRPLRLEGTARRV